MKLLITGRGGGKTYTVLKWLAADESRCVLVASTAMAENLRNTIREEKTRRGEKVTAADHQRVLTVRQVLNGAHRGWARTMSVDEIEMVLPMLLGMDVDIVTGTVPMMERDRS